LKELLSKEYSYHQALREPVLSNLLQKNRLESGIRAPQPTFSIRTHLPKLTIEAQIFSKAVHCLHPEYINARLCLHRFQRFLMNLLA
jgi:hypothetical protein